MRADADAASLCCILLAALVILPLLRCLPMTLIMMRVMSCCCCWRKTGSIVFEGERVDTVVGSDVSLAAVIESSSGASFVLLFLLSKWLYCYC